MPAPASFSEQILALPAGAGGVNGLGETFAADPYTGTGRYRIPIPVPDGHRGSKPELALVYSSGAGAGICGAGWSFGVGSVRRRTDKGVPTYGDDDVFLLGDEELVPVGDGFFVRRVEGAFARIRRVASKHEDFWAVTDRTGTRRLYGRTRADREGPDDRTGSWLPSEIRDPNDNRVNYTWERDPAGNRSYLSQIVWGAGMYRARLTYTPRPDVLRNARAGYVERTDRRLSMIEIDVKRTSNGAYAPFDRITLGYTESPITGISLLSSVQRTGISPTGGIRAWPMLSMTYAAPSVGPSPLDLIGHPGRALKDPDLSLCDFDGDGLPDLLDSTSTGWVLRRNLGDGRFATPVPVRGPAARLRQVGVFFSDVRGSAVADLVTPAGFYPNDGQGFGTFRRFDQRPSFELESPDARLVDVTGDGVGDVVVQSGAELVIFGNRHADTLPGGREARGFADAQRVPSPERLPRLGDPWTRIADADGDGLTDWVRVSRGSLEVFPSLGHGRFGAPRLLPFPERLSPTISADAIQLGDVTGSGCADVIVRLAREIWIFPNGTGERLGPKIVVHTRPLSDRGIFETVDLLGSGVKGLLYNEPGTRHAWTYYRLFQDRKPDLLESLSNGMGLVTTIQYGSSVDDAKRDRANGDPWRYPLPFPVMVVHAIRVEDAVSGTRAGIRYAYHHGYYAASEREFRGFAMVDQHDTEAIVADPSSSPPSRTRRFYDLGNGSRLRDRYAPVPGVLPDEPVPSHPDARRASRGSVLRQEIYTDDGSVDGHKPYLVTHTTTRVVEVIGAAQRSVFFAAPAQVDTWHTERTGEARHTVTTTVYDRYGRATEVRERGEGRAGTFTTPHEEQQAATLERYTRTTWLTLSQPEPEDYDAAYTPAWLLDAPAIVERWGVATPSDLLLSRQRYFYDGTAYQGLGYPAAPSGLTRGNLSCTLELAHTDALLASVFPSRSGAQSARDARGNYLLQNGERYVHASRSQFDSRGMITGSTDPNGNVTTVTYDSVSGLFPVSSTDALGHPTTLIRGEFPYQVTAAVDANDNRTELTYDPLGLPASKSVMGKFVSGDWQGDPPTDPTEVYEYDFATIPIRITTKTRQVREGATFDVHRYVDGLGRTVQERHTAEPDPAAPSTPRFRVTGAQVYNHKGLLVRAYQPTFSTSSTYVAASTTVPSIETVYDPLGRPIRVNHPDGTYETTDYHPWVQTVRDRNDNAGGISSSHPLYGPHLATFRPHLNTPTQKYVDALGREIAVSEDNRTETHVTRKVLDLKDQVTEVWDARNLSQATWAFTYDGIGRPISTRHTTALGDRYALDDAGGNQIWARDARGVEVTRDFDVLNRPLVEMTHNGADIKLRRQWRYVTYDENAPEFATYQAKNLFGQQQVEEKRDSDGLRFFEYDWRGLVTKTSHRFWSQEDSGGRPWDDPASQLWTEGANWDPEISAADRDSIPTYLELPDLTDATTLAIETIYDAAARSTEVSYPEGMTSRNTYNAAGLLEKVEVDRGTGTGYQVVVEALAYNARGQLTYLKHGNGVETTREYDEALERLSRIFTRRVQAPTTHFQDLAYAYDPVGNPLQITDNLSGSSFSHNQIIPNTRTFGYDPRYQLIKATGKKHRTVRRKDTNVLVISPDPNDYEPYRILYAYDAVGNFTRNQEYTGGELHYKSGRLDLFNGDEIEAGSFSDPGEGNFRYDANGNTTHTPRHEELAYTHDNQVRYVNLNGGGQVRYFRHGDQRVLRLVKKNGVKALTIYLDPFECHLRKAVSGYTKLVLHVEGHGRHAQAERILAGSDPDSLNLFLHHSDHLRSGHVLTKEDGDLLSQEEYFAYGRTSDRRDARNRYGFIGVEEDKDTGLCMTGPRTYDSVSGRFLQADPSGLADGANLYIYAANNPIRRIDTNGRQDWDLSKGALIQWDDVVDFFSMETTGFPTLDDFLTGFAGNPANSSDTWSASAGKLAANFNPFLEAMEVGKAIRLAGDEPTGPAVAEAAFMAAMAPLPGPTKGSSRALGAPQLHHMYSHYGSRGARLQEAFFGPAGLDVKRSFENIVGVPFHLGPHIEKYHELLEDYLINSTYLRGIGKNQPHFSSAVKTTLQELKTIFRDPNNSWLRAMVQERGPLPWARVRNVEIPVEKVPIEFLE